jgi:hypothetical protein
MISATPGLSATYTCARLAPADIEAICDRFTLPLPTPDVPLDVILQDFGRTPQQIWAELADTTDVRLMIAAAALRGDLTQLPPDPRLSPKPYPKSPVKAPRSAAEAARSPAPPPPKVPPARRQLTSVAPNPKKRGSASWDRYALYVVGATEPELISRGLLAADIRWDTQRGFVAWAELPEESK